MKIKCKTYEPGIETRYAQVKRDGIWLELDGNGHAWTSHPSVITPQVRDYPWFRDDLPAPVYGELWVPGKPASYVKSALKHQDPDLTFSPFASMYHGANVELEVLDLYFESLDLQCPEYHVINHEDPFIIDSEEPLQDDQEGWVFKDGNRLNWYKWKPVRTIDLVITGYRPGKAKYTGQMGSIVCAVQHDEKWYEVCNVSGMDESVRLWFTQNADAMLNRVIEVAYQYVGSQGRLRHPRYIRYRDDKQVHQCMSNQDPELERTLCRLLA